MYSSAKCKDFVDSIKLEIKDNNLVLSIKAETNQVLTGLISSAITLHLHHMENSRFHSKKASCFSNQRVLQGAVEMYNMDHSTMMSTLDIDTLVKEKYLHQKPIAPDPQCKYEAVGDLTQDGYVNCKFHGNPMNR